MKSLAIIGAGAIARTLIEGLRGSGPALAALLVRPGREHAAATLAPPGCQVVTDVRELIALEPDLVAECAGHSAVAEHGEPVLEAGILLAVISTGAFADAALLERLLARARAAGSQIIVPAGAVAGIDALAAARPAGLTRVGYTSRKPPRAWTGTPAEAQCDLGRLGAPFTHYQGDARRAARLYPQNANVAATIALAGIGFERTEVSLIADPGVDANVHEIAAEGAFGRLHIEVRGATLPGNAKTSALAAYSMTRCVRSGADSFVI